MTGVVRLAGGWGFFLTAFSALDGSPGIPIFSVYMPLKPQDNKKNVPDKIFRKP